MTNWLRNGASRYFWDGTANSNISVVCGTSYALSSWAEDIAATTYDYFGFWLQAKVCTYSGYLYSFDLGLGSSGNEFPIVSEMVVPRMATAGQYATFSSIFIPIFIPAGSRISSRGRCSASSTYNFYAGLSGVIDNPIMPVFGRSQYMHVDASNIKGRDVDPGGTADTWGSWTSLNDGPLGFDARFVVILNTTNDTARTSASWNIQLGVGTTGSESPIMEWCSYTHSSSDFQSNWGFWGPVNIPAGADLSARAKCSINTAGDRVINCSFHFFG